MPIFLWQNISLPNKHCLKISYENCDHFYGLCLGSQEKPSYPKSAKQFGGPKRKYPQDTSVSQPHWSNLQLYICNLLNTTKLDSPQGPASLCSGVYLFPSKMPQVACSSRLQFIAKMYILISKLYHLVCIKSIFQWLTNFSTKSITDYQKLYDHSKKTDYQC